MNLSNFLENHLDEYVGQDKILILGKNGIDNSHIPTQSYTEIRIVDHLKTNDSYLVKLQFLTYNAFYPVNTPVWLDHIDCATWQVIK